VQFISNIIPVVERSRIPDTFARFAISLLVARTSSSLSAREKDGTNAFARAMSEMPIATNVAEANVQHYELPPTFFELILGPRCKYSCCYYESEASSLADAEEAALEATVRNADIADGQTVLELGGGWGSFALFAAQRFPKAKIVAVSNSSAQRNFIEKQIVALGLDNLLVVTADMNHFQPDRTFDRVVSIEMFEHMANWPQLLARIRSWIKPDGRLFVHIFNHRSTPYRFDHNTKRDWIAQHFFTGGIMPSHDLLRKCTNDFRIEDEWLWNGSHYRQTAEHWLDNFDRHTDAIEGILCDVYGDEANVWRQRWRFFFLATAGLFGHKNGQDWGVSHYRLKPVALHV
jgi:cyclopropane-fatty-acyl-phospholipid synthase